MEKGSIVEEEVDSQTRQLMEEVHSAVVKAALGGMNCYRVMETLANVMGSGLAGAYNPEVGRRPTMDEAISMMNDLREVMEMNYRHMSAAIEGGAPVDKSKLT